MGENNFRAHLVFECNDSLASSISINQCSYSLSEGKLHPGGIAILDKFCDSLNEVNEFNTQETNTANLSLNVYTENPLTVPGFSATL